MPLSLIVRVRQLYPGNANGPLRLGNLLVGERLVSRLVDRVGCVGNQLAQENLLMRVQRVNHKIQELFDFGLELMFLLCHG